MKPSKLFSASDRDRVREAVQTAESKTSGEIVPYVVEASDNYEVAVWRAGILLGVLSLGAFVIIRQTTELWLPFDFVQMGLVALFAAASGALLAHLVPALQRFCAGRHLLDLRVHQRATQAFLTEEVFATRERTGILIFLSLRERRVVVLGDSGIHARVKPSDWDGIVRTVVSGMKAGRTTEALITAINDCGQLLEKHGVQRRADDRDELSDDVRLEDK